MDKIFIINLRAHGIIGILPEERITPQDMLINVTAEVDTTKAAKSDNISDCVSYSWMAEEILRIAETAKRFIVEALANDIAELCLSDSKVFRVLVRVEKPGAVKEAESVGVEIQRGR